MVVEIGCRRHVLADQRRQPLQHVQLAIPLKTQQAARQQLRVGRQPRLDLGGWRVQQQRDQTGVPVEPGDAAAALAHCIEQPLDPLIQLVVQRQRENRRFQRIECKGFGDRREPAIGRCICVVRKAPPRPSSSADADLAPVRHRERRGAVTGEVPRRPGWPHPAGRTPPRSGQANSPARRFRHAAIDRLMDVAGAVQRQTHAARSGVRARSRRTPLERGAHISLSRYWMKKECAACASEADAHLKIRRSLTGTEPDGHRQDASRSNGYEANSNDGARSLQMVVVGSVAWHQRFCKTGNDRVAIRRVNSPRRR